MIAKNPFAKQSGFLKRKELVQRVLLFLGTYSIITVTLLIFGVIIFSGLPVLKKYGFDFITRSPETLEVVVFDESEKLSISAKSFEVLKTYNPEEGLFTNDTEFVKSFPHVSFKIQPNSFISDTYLSQIEKDNDFFAIYKSRDTKALVGFTLQKDQKLNLLPESYQNLLESKPAFLDTPAEDIEIKKKSYLVNFKTKSCEMQAKTIVALSKSSLVYKLYGNLTDTADDNASKLMLLDIPKNQEIKLTPAQYRAYQSDTGSAKFGDGQEIVETTPRKSFSIKAGSYQLPLEQLAEISAQNPSADLYHFHNLDSGVIELDLAEATPALQVPKEIFEKMKEDNPLLNISDVKQTTIDHDYVSFSLTKPYEIKLPTSDMSSLKESNQGEADENGEKRLNILSEDVYPYSSGGVAGPIWGTILLVLGCMIIALAIGVAAAVYLGEYAKKGKLVTIIRLSMMNLAGVPSIVFGLFGLGLFVTLAPKITDTPTIDNSKARMALFPSFSEPNLRSQEDNKVTIVNEEAELIHQLRAAQQQGKTNYYDGWYYVSLEGWGNSIIAGCFTLAIMVLPIIITSSEESLRAVPKGFREASLALGATKWQSIRTAVLPYATPGILTASVLGVTRVAGETAPIMFTAAIAAKSDLPYQGHTGSFIDQTFSFLSQSVQAMPYHIYTVSGRLPPSDHISDMRYGSVLVFMIIVMSFAALSVYLRVRMRKKYKW